MMARYRCNSCGGEYLDRLPDGMFYYHVCPPERVPAPPGVEPDGTRFLAHFTPAPPGTLADGRRFIAQVVDGAPVVMEKSVIEVRERADCRNENIAESGPQKGKEKAPGLGRTEVLP